MLFLEGKSAIVTGASRGIGRAVAIELGRRGADVVVNYLADSAGAETTREAVEAAGGRAVTHRADVRRPEAAKLLIESLALLPLQSDQPSHPKTTARILTGPLRRITTGRVAIAICALGILSALTPAAIIFASILLTLGELIERSLYFRAVSAPRMPGLK